MAEGSVGAEDVTIYLHGDLDLIIVEARSLRSMDSASEHLRGCFTCQSFKSNRQGQDEPLRRVVGHGIREDRNKLLLHAKVIHTHSDPYVTVNVPGSTLARTRVISSSKNPKWDEHFNVLLAHPLVHLEFQIKDDDVFGSQLIGTVLVPAARVMSGEYIDEAFPVIDSTGKLRKIKMELHVKMKFTPCEQNPLYCHGIAGDPEHKGVRDTYFPLRKGGSVRLYQDAHVTDDLLPRIELDGGMFYEHQNCWEDICYAICEAHHMINIVGWSVYHKIKLVREPTKPLPRGGDLTLGELLKYKTQDGVRVLLLVWDDKTSHDKLFLRTMAEGSVGAEDVTIYLHGDLDLIIVEARSLRSMDSASEHLRGCFTCQSFKSNRQGQDEPLRRVVGHGIREDRNKLLLHAKVIHTHSDPYVTVNVPGSTLARTRVISSSKNPKWDEHFNVLLAHPLVHLEFQIKDDDVFGSQLIGTVLVPAARVMSGEYIDEAFPVIDSTGKLRKIKMELHVKMKFTPCEQNPLYCHGIAGDPEHKGVRDTYFPLRKGGSVRLYQDAHVTDDLLPRIELDGGMFYEHQNCWEDICYAICEAHHMINIVGWSVYHKIKLVREPTKPLPRGGDLTLGELLKYKTQDGVRVLLLVWDDKTSHDKLFLRTEGVMATHDEELKKYFKHSSVTCVLAPRYGSSKLGFIKQKIVGGIFTHHQKCVIVDTQAPGSNRKITSFIGGLDLCDGRYDTPKHRLFQDLDTVYQGDFHNPTFSGGLKAPREPWHDLHCRLEGPAAFDVLMNFKQRWVKSTRWKEFGKRIKSKANWHADSLINIERISWIISPPIPDIIDDIITCIPNEEPSVWVSTEDDPETWHVQIFRSIDSGSLRGFPKDWDTAKSLNLICSKNLVIDKSVQTAYVQAIRSAKHFIYIENQYFLGSSYAWPSYKNAGADHLIPMELALKIVSKIRAKERFSIYIIIPMWPEGDPKTAIVQEILYWQSQTMEMMYRLVAQELNGLDLPGVNLLDYLNFYCLGNREEIPPKVLAETDDNDQNGGYKVTDSFKYQRFMIYVHAKGMIVDDEYIIIGSANINQRSMAGTNDTEIAMGSYQPHHTWASKQRHPHGQIYAFRKSLWAEHLGMLCETFEKPESLDCVQKVNEIALDNWKRFTDESFSSLQGHLLKYPIQVTSEGMVCPLPGFENFPDVGGSVLGSYSAKFPGVLTT